MHVLFGCDNYNVLRQDTLKKINAIGNIELDTSNRLQKLKFLLSDGYLKSLNKFDQYIYETRNTKGELVLYHISSIQFTEHHN